MKIRRYLTILAAVAMLSGCYKSPDMPMQQISVDKDAIVSAASGAEYTVSVISNTKWKILSSSVDWVSASPEQSTGNTDVVLTVRPNDGEAREMELKLVSVSDNTISSSVVIRQASAKEGGVISISELRSMSKDGEKVKMTEGSVRGFIVSNVNTENWFANSIAIEDSFTSPESGITVMLPEMPSYAAGVEVAVPLADAVLYRNDAGYLVLEASGADSTDVTPVEVKPLSVDYTALASGKYESMYVSSMLQITDAGLSGVLGDCPLLEDGDGNNVRLKVMEESALALSQAKDGSCPVGGLGGFAAAVPELTPTSSSDVLFNGMRFGIKVGIRQLPYILSFYAKTMKNKDLKYSTVKDGTYAKLGTDFYLKDKDDRTGAVMEAKATSAMTGSGQFRMSHWADKGAHDNIPGKSFTGDDGSGYYLTVPLQMDLPSTFHVAFGLAGTGSAVKNWKLEYSSDKETWKSGADFMIDKPISGSGFYYYYDIKLSPDTKFSAGQTLYLRWTATGNTSVNNGVTAGLGSDVRFACCVALFGEYSASTSVPSGAVYYEPFDNLTGGLDYLWGDRLAAMMNFCGSDIADWTAAQRNGLTGENVHQRRGYAQIGYVESQAVARAKYVNTLGSLTTPSFGTAGNLVLSFDAMSYHTPADRAKAKAGEPADKKGDLTSVVVKVVGGGTIDGKTEVTVDGLTTDKFTNFKLNIKDATSGTKVTFTSAPAAGDFSRWFIDNILVTK